MPRMFQRFHRVEGTRGRSHEGSGIGLALVQELVKLHGGRIEVRSTLGKGTEFTVTLPKGRDHLPADCIKPARAALPQSMRPEAYLEEIMGWLPGGEPIEKTSALRGGRILVADDNADMRDYLRRLLAKDFTVETVSDGEQALAAIRAHRPDLVISDVMMPLLDGIGLVRAVRADPELRATPLMLLSARAGEEARIHGMGSGADDYLVKPFSARELLVRAGALIHAAEARRQAHEELAHTAAQLESLLDAAPLGVYLVDDNFRLAAVNPVARPVFGLAEPLIGRDFEEVIHLLWDRAAASELVARFRHTLESGEPHVVSEWVNARIDRPATEFYEWQIHRLPLPGGRHGVVCYFRDITTVVLTREALREADQRKNEFIATLSHELRNPLAPLRNALHILSSSKPGAASMPRIQEMMERQVNHLVRLVDDLLEVSRFTRGEFALLRESVEVAAIVRNASEMVEPLVRESRHELSIDVPPEPIVVDGDAARLIQLLGNVLSNAAKYTPAGGRIGVRARREGEYATVSVVDNGAGIAAEDRERIFDMFARGRASGASGGLGIGLALARKLATMHGGSLTARSAGPGHGSEFVIRLPVAAAVPAPAHDVDAAGPALRGRRVLVVDDNCDAAESLAMILQMQGGEVRVAHSGAEALATLEHFEASILLLDIGMPEMDGYEVARRIRAQYSGRLPVLVALTGWGQEDDRVRAREAGFDHHLVKPAELRSLQALLAAI